MRLNKWEGVLDGDGGGFVDPLPEFAPETVQHELGGGLATSVFGNAADIESDTLPLLVTKNIVSFLLEGLTPTGPPRRFLFDLDPRVDVMGEETRLTLLGGKFQTSWILTRVYPFSTALTSSGVQQVPRSVRSASE